MTPNERDLYARIEAMSLSEARMALARNELGQGPDSESYLFSYQVISAREKDERENSNASLIENKVGTTAPSDKHQDWHKRPLGDLALKVIGGVLTFLAVLALATHFGLGE